MTALSSAIAAVDKINTFEIKVGDDQIDKCIELAELGQTADDGGREALVFIKEAIPWLECLRRTLENGSHSAKALDALIARAKPEEVDHA